MFSRKNQKGDTIVEVLISIAVLAIVLGTAYVTTSRSLQTGTNASNRNQALGYAQSQLEIIKSAGNSGSGSIDQYEISSPFCIDTATGDVIVDLSNCAIGANSYRNEIIYDGSSKVYTITTKWESADGGEDQLVLYYKTGLD